MAYTVQLGGILFVQVYLQLEIEKMPGLNLNYLSSPTDTTKHLMCCITDLKIRSMNILHVIKKNVCVYVCVFIYIHPVSLSEVTRKAYMQGLRVEFCTD